MVCLTVSILRPTGQTGPSPETDLSISDFSKNILENLEKCQIAQYIISRQKNHDFVKRGNKTELGLHFETCEVCNGRREPPSSISNPSPTIEISHLAQKRLNDWKQRAGINYENLTQVLEDALGEAFAKKEERQNLERDYENLKKKYEELKIIKLSQLRQEKQTAVELLQSKKIKYYEELLKRHEARISKLQDRIAELEKVK